ncbi:MAG: hypothetical protein WAV05_07080 [Anaerolineales bacterium]
MSAYERNVIEREIKSQIESLYPTIYAGIMSEYKPAVQALKKAQEKIAQAQVNEINRWDATRLNAELQATKTLVDLALAGGGGGFFDGGSPGPSNRIEAIFQDAHKSDDVYKKRATFEVIKALAPKAKGDDKFQINHLAKLADQGLSSIRITDEMKQSEQQASEAFQAYLEKRKELVEVAKTLGQGDPENVFTSGDFNRAIRMVQVDRETGNINIYEENSPEVLGVWMKNQAEAEKIKPVE